MLLWGLARAHMLPWVGPGSCLGAAGNSQMNDVARRVSSRRCAARPDHALQQRAARALRRAASAADAAPRFAVPCCTHVRQERHARHAVACSQAAAAACAASRFRW
jgi:hypothetical protein